MQLTLQDRYVLKNLLPVEGSYTLMTRVNELRERLEASKAEKEKFGVTDVVDTHGQPTGRLWWDPEKKTEREIEIGQSMTDVTVKILKKLNDGEKLSGLQVSLFKRFVEIPEAEARAAAKAITEGPAEKGAETES